MKKTMGFVFVTVLLAALSAKAVVIHWAVSDLPAGATSAQLVYVSSGVPTFANDALSNGENVGSLVSGLAVTPLGIGEQSTSDGTTRLAGNYYVVLFNNSSQFAYSTALAYDNTTFISQDEFTPATGTFDPASFSSWAPVPEPGSIAMLALGVGLLALRRKRLG
jgi:hypothetical protein